MDRRQNAYRDDLADIRLRDRASAPNYAEGRPSRIIVGRAPVHRGPEPGSPLDTHYHYGERILVFDKTRTTAWCQSAEDSYVGYIATRHLALGEPPQPTHFIANHGAYTYRVPDLRAAPLDFLPRHSPAVVAETGIDTRGTEYARLDPAGFLPVSCLSPSPPRSADLVAAASLYLGAPYLWGGRSFMGLDCSGLVQQAFRDLGVAVLRDTDMQRETIGAPASPDDLRRGDLIFIPGHVMIHAGGGEVIHASGAGMAVRRDNLAGIVRNWGLDPAQFVVRRP
ncbi:MAG TPA: NlpC/P60 family protein [Stellaceae bacterium]|jgi:cell wall-associated NlpC family hydrolase|nr:NlpC/P60 family protein [Stellaceae bacterium]